MTAQYPILKANKSFVLTTTYPTEISYMLCCFGIAYIYIYIYIYRWINDKTGTGVCKGTH